MYKLIRNEWNLALHDFSGRLIRALADGLVMVLGLDEDARAFDSNVLVVVSRLDDSVRTIVARAALEVNDAHDCVLCYNITTQEDEALIHEFQKVAETIRGS